MNKISSFILLLLFVFASALPVTAHGENSTDQTVALDLPDTEMDLALTLRIPLLSPYFIETPVAAVNGDPIMLGEFVQDFSSGQPDKVQAESFERRLETLVQKKLDGTDKTKGEVEYFAQSDSISGGYITVSALLFSPLFIDVPVAVINGEPIRFGTFAGEVLSMYTGMAEGELATHDYAGLLDRLVTVELVELEARNIGLDETDYIKNQVSNFADKALAKLLLQDQSKDVVPNAQEVDEAYKSLSLEVKVMTVKIATESDAQKFVEDYQSKEDFKTLAQALVDEGRGEFSDAGDYVHINELLPIIKTDISELDPGSISKIYRAPDKGFLIFKLIDRRFVEDIETLQEIERNNLAKERQVHSFAYIETLEKKYVRYDTDAQNAMDFVAQKDKNPDLDMREYLKQLRDDQRVLVRFEGDDRTITIAEVAEKINESFYHGLEKTVTAEKLDTEKKKALYDMEFRITSRLEAESLGLDKDDRYVKDVEKYEKTLIFESFLERVIAPEVTITQDEVRQSYEARINEFSSPAMLKLKSLVFTSEDNAEVAMNRLKSGSDFKWVSANSSGLVDKSEKGILAFEGNLLSSTALPKGLQEEAAEARNGDVMLYADPGKYFYVLQVEMSYPPQPKPFESVRSEVGNALYGKKFKEILDKWISGLKDAYKTEVYLAD